MDIYTEMWQMMRKFDFSSNSSSLIDLICVICDKLVINACQGPCGCIYCQSCINFHLEREIQSCPGGTEICRAQESGNVSFKLNVIKDNHVNRRVSKLYFKCPFDSCTYNCKLFDMPNHLLNCDRNEIRCPYIEIGCTVEVFHGEGLSNHFRDDIYLHSKLLNDWILNTKNEISSLINSNHQEDIENELQVLNSKLTEIILDQNQTQQVQIEQLKIEINSVKNKYIELEKTIKEMKSQMKTQTNEINKLKDNCNEISALKRSINKMKICNSFVNSSSIVNSELELMSENKSISDPDLIENELKIAGTFLWDIPNFNKTRKKGISIWSKDFFTLNNNYRIRLLLDPCSNNNKERLSIRIFIYNGTEISHFNWPFIANVKLSIRNKNDSDCSKSLMHHLTVDKPAGKLNTFNFFYFLNEELEQAGVFHGVSIVVECIIFYEKEEPVFIPSLKNYPCYPDSE